MSTQKIYVAVIEAAKKRFFSLREGNKHLDIGAGRGELIQEYATPCR